MPRRLLSTMLVLLGFATSSLADNCGFRAPVYYYPPVAKKVYYPPAVAQFAPVAFLPTSTFSVGYNPQGDMVQALYQIAQNQAAMAKQQEITNQILLQGNPNAAAFAQPTALAAINQKAHGVFTAKCASCHTGAAAKKGYQLFTAPGQFNVAKFNDPKERSWVLHMTALMKGTPKQMPPSENLTGEEELALAEWAAGQKLAQPQQQQTQTTQK